LSFWLGHRSHQPASSSLGDALDRDEADGLCDEETIGQLVAILYEIDM